jgi:hypothetical protein
MGPWRCPSPRRPCCAAPGYVRLLALAALLEVVVPTAAYGFLVSFLQQEIFTHLPHGLGFAAEPAWWPLPVLTVGGCWPCWRSPICPARAVPPRSAASRCTARSTATHAAARAARRSWRSANHRAVPASRRPGRRSDRADGRDTADHHGLPPTLVHRCSSQARHSSDTHRLPGPGRLIFGGRGGGQPRAACRRGVLVIAARLGRATSTVSRKVAGGGGRSGGRHSRSSTTPGALHSYGQPLRAVKGGGCMSLAR